MASDTPLYLRPNSASTVVASVGAGTILPVMGRSGDWYEIELPGDVQGLKRQAFVQAEAVEPLSETKPPSVVTTPREEPGGVASARGRIYSDWHGMDEVEIFQPFRVADFTGLVVMLLDKSGVALPPQDENTYAPTVKILERSDEFFLEGLRRGVAEFRRGFTVESDSRPSLAPLGGSKILVLRTKLLMLDPGSKAARYWGGFGAGAGKAKISAELIDVATDTVLARLTHEKRSGFGMFGGGYEKVMSKSIREVGEDFGKGLMKPF